MSLEYSVFTIRMLTIDGESLYTHSQQRVLQNNIVTPGGRLRFVFIKSSDHSDLVRTQHGKTNKRGIVGAMWANVQRFCVYYMDNVQRDNLNSYY